MRTAISIDIGAPPELVFALAQDVTRWERLLPHYARSRPERRHGDGSITCSFVARRPLIGVLGLGLPVAWRSRVSVDPARHGLHFEHLGGATAGMVVDWRIEPRHGSRAHVEIAHWLERGPADLLPGFIDRFFTQPIAGRTLATFKDLAESIPYARGVP